MENLLNEKSTDSFIPSLTFSSLRSREESIFRGSSETKKTLEIEWKTMTPEPEKLNQQKETRHPWGKTAKQKWEGKSWKSDEGCLVLRLHLWESHHQKDREEEKDDRRKQRDCKRHQESFSWQKEEKREEEAKEEKQSISQEKRVKE